MEGHEGWRDDKGGHTRSIILGQRGGHVEAGGGEGKFQSGYGGVSHDGVDAFHTTTSATWSLTT